MNLILSHIREMLMSRFAKYVIAIILAAILGAGSLMASRDGSQPHGPGYVVAADYGPPSRPAILTAQTAAGTKQIILTPGAWTIDRETTITSPLRVLPGALLTRSGGAHLIIQGPFECGLHQAFADNTPGHDWVTFGSGTAKSLHPEWWGAKADNSTDCSSAVTAWLKACISSGIEGQWSNGTYKINSQVAATMAAGESLTISGQGGNSIIDCSGVPYLIGYGQPEVYGIFITGAPSTDPNNICRLSNFRMIGGATNLGGLVGLHLKNVGQTILSGLVCTGMPMDGIRLTNIKFASVIECYCSSNYYSGLSSGGTSVKVFGGEFNMNGGGLGPAYGAAGGPGIGYGLIVNAKQVAVYGARCSGNDRYGIDFRAGSDAVIDGCYVYNSGLVGIHGANYEIAPTGAVNIKIINNTVDNCDRRGTPGIQLDSAQGIKAGVEGKGKSWTVPVNELLISGNTIKRTLDAAILVGAHKLNNGSTSVKKLIIENNQIEHTNQTDWVASRLITAGDGSVNDYINNTIIVKNQIFNGAIFVGYGDVANVSDNQITLTGAGPLYYNYAINSFAKNSILNANTIISPIYTWTVNPFLRSAGGGNYSGLSYIREMKSNIVNGTHPPGLWDWVFNRSELSFKYASVISNNVRPYLEVIFKGGTKKAVSINGRYTKIGGADNTPTIVSGLFMESLIVDNAGTTTFSGPSPYTITPFRESVIGPGPPAMTWYLNSAANGFRLETRSNAPGDNLEGEIKMQYSGTISTIKVHCPNPGVNYIH